MTYGLEVRRRRFELAAALAFIGMMWGCSGNSGVSASQDAEADAGPGVDADADEERDAGSNIDADEERDAETNIDAEADAVTNADGEAEADTEADATVDASPLPECAAPIFSPVSGALVAGTNVVIASPGLPAGGFIFLTTDGTYPNNASRVYTGGSTGIQVTQSETINAIAYAQGRCSPSPLASATYTIAVDAGSAVGTPLLTPAGGTTFHNDQSVTISSAGSAAICYTLDGTTPACTPIGGCSVGALYGASSGGIALPPVGSASIVGSYTISAVGCAPEASSSVESQSYAMVAAAPTSSVPSGAVLWTQSLTTTLSTATADASIYTAQGTTPVCGVQPALAGGIVPIQSGTLDAIACKPGYHPSAVASSAYLVNLNLPIVTPATTTQVGAFSATVSDAANAGSGDWICYSSGMPGSIDVPTCGVSAGICATGLYLPSAGGGGMVGVSASGSEVEALACAPSGLSSTTIVMGGPYRLQLSAPYVLAVANGAAPPGSAQYTLSSVTPIVIGQAGTSASPAAQEASFACYIQDPLTGQVAACGGDGVTCAAGATKITLGADGPYWDTGAGGFGAFGADEAVSVVVCPGPSGANAGYLASAPVTVEFGGSTPAAAVTLSNTTSNVATYTSPVFPILVNTNASAVTACFTVDGSTPGCSAGTCVGATTRSLALDGAASPSHALAIGTALEDNGTQLAIVACSPELGSSPVGVYSFANSFALATPTASVPAGTIHSGTSIHLSTTSTFSDTTVAYSFDGSPPDCAGMVSTIIHGSSGSTSPSDLPPPGFSAHLLAVACAGTAATSQTTSALFDSGAYTVIP